MGLSWFYCNLLPKKDIKNQIMPRCYKGAVSRLHEFAPILFMTHLGSKEVMLATGNLSSVWLIRLPQQFSLIMHIQYVHTSIGLPRHTSSNSGSAFSQQERPFTCFDQNQPIWWPVASQFHTCNPLEKDLKQAGPSAQLLTSQKSSSPSATSCCQLLLWVAGIMEYLESKKNMLPTSMQGSNGKEDFMCIKPWVYIHASAVQPQLCHTSRQCQQCLFCTPRHPQSPQGQGGCSPAQEQPCRDPIPRSDTPHEHFSADAGLCTQLWQEHLSSSKKHCSNQTNQLSFQSVCSQSLVTETINISFVCNSQPVFCSFKTC